MSQLRVLMVQTQAESAGAQEIARVVGEGLGARGYDVHHAFFFRRTDAFDRVPKTFFCATDRPSSVGGVLHVLRRLHRHVRALRPDAVLCFQHYGNLLAAPVARLAGIRTVIANQNTTRGQMKRAVVAADTLLGTLGVYTRVVVNSANTDAEWAAAPSRYRRRIVRIDHGFSPKRATLGREAARRRFALPLDAPVVGYVARLDRDKNHAAAIAALALRPGLHLAVMGQGAAEPELRTLAGELGCAGRVHFLGEHQASGVGDFLGCLDAFVFPSRRETFGLAAVEAAAAGLPVIANALPVLHEVLQVDGKPCAVFVDVENTEAFAAAIDTVLADGPVRRRLQQLGPHMEQRYALSAMVDGYDRLIRSTIAGPVPSPRDAPA